MRYVVSYDIADDRRRDRVAEMLKGFGRRIQESVFLAELDEELASEMRSRFGKMLHGEDCGHVFVICGACIDRAEVFGRGQLESDSDFYIV